MALGVPVLAGDSAAVREVTADAALLCDAADAAALCAALSRLCGDAALYREVAS